jgi:hypothetical protein
MKSAPHPAAVGAAIVVAFLLLRKRAPIPSVSTTATYDLEPLGGGVTDYPPRLIAFAQGIATAEGFYVPGSVPQRANNPGAMKVPNWTGPTLGQGITVFQSDDAGWSALYRQLMLIVTGRSRVYTLDDTIASMAVRWAAGGVENEESRNWAANVSKWLNVPDSTPLSQVLV